MKNPGRRPGQSICVTIGGRDGFLVWSAAEGQTEGSCGKADIIGDALSGARCQPSSGGSCSITGAASGSGISSWRKAGFTAYLSGLRNRLARKGVQVVTVLPGFVATKMTAGMKLPKRLTASPDEVASTTFAAVEKLGDIIFTSLAWQLMIFGIRSAPETIFKRTRL